MKSENIFIIEKYKRTNLTSVEFEFDEVEREDLLKFLNKNELDVLENKDIIDNKDLKRKFVKALEKISFTIVSKNKNEIVLEKVSEYEYKKIRFKKAKKNEFFNKFMSRIERFLDNNSKYKNITLEYKDFGGVDNEEAYELDKFREIYKEHFRELISNVFSSEVIFHQKYIDTQAARNFSHLKEYISYKIRKNMFVVIFTIIEKICECYENFDYKVIIKAN